jgi:hypothetical protein
MASNTHTTAEGKARQDAGTKKGETPRRAFSTVKQAAEDLASSFAARDEDLETYEKIFKIAPDTTLGQSQKTGVKTLYDPQGYNAISSAVRMYAANEPSISVPTETGDGGEGYTETRGQELATLRRDADQVERFLRALMYAHATVSDRDPFMDSLYSIFLHGVINIVQYSPLDALADDASREELDEIECPFRFRIPNARLCYPRYSEWGDLISHVYKSETTVADAREHFAGRSELEITGADDDDATIWDVEYKDQRVVWREEQGTGALVDVPLDYGFMTRVSRRGASPGFFSEPEYQHIPLLFAYLKAGLFAATNLLLTVQYNNVVDFSNPILAVFTDGDVPTWDWDKAGSSVQFPKDARLDRMYRGLVPPELINLLQQVGMMSQDSTISRASLGALPNQAMAAAAMNLISQSSRIATFLGARAAELAWEAAFSKMLRKIFKRGQPVTVWGRSGPVTLKPSQVQKNYRVRVHFRPDQQLEKNAIAGLASMLFSNLGIGYDTAYEILEEGGIVESASVAFENHLERLFIDHELPKVAKETADYVRRLIGAAKAVPEVNSGPPAVGGGQGPLTAGSAQPAPAAPGAPGAPMPAGMAVPNPATLPGGDQAQALAELLAGGGGNQ